MSDIYISEDGDAVVDLQSYSAQYEKRIVALQIENEKLRRDADTQELREVSEMTAHKHADLMALYAEDAKETETPWAQWEFRPKNQDNWAHLNRHPEWGAYTEYRRKPQKKIMWQWIYEYGEKVFLTNGFYPSWKSVKEEFSNPDSNIIGPAKWTRIEVND